MYWIDPNGGSTSDAIEVFCRFTTDAEKAQTCLVPQSEQVGGSVSKYPQKHDIFNSIIHDQTKLTN